MLIPFKTLINKYNIHPQHVLHIGAHWGEEAHDYYSNGIISSIWIEANPLCIEILNQRVLNYPDVRVINACISDKDGEEVILNISNNEGQSSSILDLQYHKIAHPEVSYIDKITIQSSRIDTLLGNSSLFNEGEIFVNIDIQGAELLALKSFGNLLNKVKYLYLEVNEKELYKNCPLISDIEEYIDSFDFERKEKAMAGNFGWGDAFYINKNK